MWSWFHFAYASSISPSEKGTIRTIKANYGRLDQHLCSSKPSIMTFCMAPEFPSSVERLYVYVNDQTGQVPEWQDLFSTPLTLFFSIYRCQGSVACSVTINPKIMPRTVYCDNNPKYAYVSYVCEQRWAVHGHIGVSSTRGRWFSPATQRGTRPLLWLCKGSNPFNKWEKLTSGFLSSVNIL